MILVYDCSSRATFNSIANWLRQIEEHAEDGVLRVLVSNKNDIPNPEVSENEGKALADKFGLEYYSASAKTGTGVEELFGATCRKVISSQLLREERKASNSDLQEPTRLG